MRRKMKMYQQICFKKPAIKRSEEIIEDENCSNTSRHVKEKVDVIIQDSISSVNDKYFLDKQRKHQDKGDDGRERNYTQKRLIVAFHSIATAILKRHRKRRQQSLMRHKFI